MSAGQAGCYHRKISGGERALRSSQPEVAFSTLRRERYTERPSASLSRAALRYGPLRGRQRLGAWTGVFSIEPLGCGFEGLVRRWC